MECESTDGGEDESVNKGIDGVESVDSDEFNVKLDDLPILIQTQG